VNCLEILVAHPHERNDLIVLCDDSFDLGLGITKLREGLGEREIGCRNSYFDDSRGCVALLTPGSKNITKIRSRDPSSSSTISIRMRSNAVKC
jgi:hypothetical protein